MLLVNETLKDGERTTVHRFEHAGLGLAPFRFTGEVTEKTYQACPGAPVQAGSTCDYCGTCIRYEFWIVSSDSKRHKVGCDCIHKTGDTGLVAQISVAERKLRDAKNQRARAAKQAKLAVRIEAARVRFAEIKGRLAQEPHPVPHHAANGLTKADYVTWLYSNGYAEKAMWIVEAV